MFYVKLKDLLKTNNEKNKSNSISILFDLSFNKTNTCLHLPKSNSINSVRVWPNGQVKCKIL